MALSNEAKKARAEFRKTYSSNTAEILRRIASGQDNNTIATAVKVSPATVVTVKGNLTRNFYAPYATRDGNKVVGTCEF